MTYNHYVFLVGFVIGVCLILLIRSAINNHRRGKDGRLIFDFSPDTEEPVKLMFDASVPEMIKQGYISIQVICKDDSRDEQWL